MSRADIYRRFAVTCHCGECPDELAARSRRAAIKKAYRIARDHGGNVNVCRVVVKEFRSFRSRPVLHIPGRIGDCPGCIACDPKTWSLIDDRDLCGGGGVVDLSEVEI